MQEKWGNTLSTLEQQKHLHMPLRATTLAGIIALSLLLNLPTNTKEHALQKTERVTLNLSIRGDIVINNDTGKELVPEDLFLGDNHLIDIENIKNKETFNGFNGVNQSQGLLMLRPIEDNEKPRYYAVIADLLKQGATALQVSDQIRGEEWIELHTKNLGQVLKSKNVEGLPVLLKQNSESSVEGELVVPDISEPK